MSEAPNERFWCNSFINIVIMIVIATTVCRQFHHHITVTIIATFNRFSDNEVDNQKALESEKRLQAEPESDVVVIVAAVDAVTVTGVVAVIAVVAVGIIVVTAVAAAAAEVTVAPVVCELAPLGEPFSVYVT